MGTPSDEIDSKTNTLIDLVELNENAFKFPSQLSGGEQTRVSIAVLQTTHFFCFVMNRQEILIS